VNPAVPFRNVDTTPDDDVSTWPNEAIVTTLERGLVSDWQPLLREVRRNPWGSVTRSIERFLGYEPIEGVAPLFLRAIARARTEADLRDREEVASRVRAAVRASGLTSGRVAELVGTSASRLSTYMNGRVTPSAAMLVRIERVSAEQERAGVSAQRGEGDSRRSHS
jgi:predicted transcriptional regulator